MDDNAPHWIDGYRRETQPNPWPDTEFEGVTGSSSRHFNNVLFDQIENSLWSPVWKGDRSVEDKMRAARDMLTSMQPQNEIEAQMIGQMIIVHNSAMDCFYEAATFDTSTEMRHKSLANAQKLVKLHAMLLSAWESRRQNNVRKVQIGEGDDTPTKKALIRHAPPARHRIRSISKES